MRTTTNDIAIPDQTGTLAVVTGANSGIGFGVSQRLAAGAMVILAVRATARGNRAAQAIRAASPDAQVVVEQLDLASLASIEAFAARLLRACAEWRHLGTGTSQPGQHDPGHRQIDEGLTAGVRALKIAREATVARDPGVGAFHDPAPGFETGFPLESLGLFSPCTNMGGKTKFVKDLAHLLVVVSFVQTHSLGMCLSWLWTLDNDALDGRAQQFHVMTVCSVNYRSNWHSMSIGRAHSVSHRSCHDRSDWAQFFLRPMGLWPWLRPLRASSS